MAKTLLQIKQDADLIAELSSQFYRVSKKDAVDLPYKLGLGKFKGVTFPSGLKLYVGSYSLNAPWQLEITINPDSKTFCIFTSIVSNQITIKKDGEWAIINRNGPNSILFFSPGASVELAFPQNEPFKTILITFTAETIRSIMDQPEIILGLNPASPFLYLDETVPEAENFINKLASICEENGPDKFDTYLTLLNLLKVTLNRTFVIKERYNSSGILKEDVDKLFAIRRQLLENSHLKIRIASLAKEVGMGESKMIKLFKQVFNRTVHQFAQKAKIIKAKDLLTSRNYTVSEVGYMVGYNNMTHFAKAFKKYYKINPGEYLKSVLLNRLTDS